MKHDVLTTIGTKSELPAKQLRAETTGPQGLGSLKVRTILLVSDEEELRTRLSAILCNVLAYVVVQSCKEQEAVDVAQSMAFDLIVVLRHTTTEEMSLTQRLRDVTNAPIFWLTALSIDGAFACGTTSVA